MEYKDTLLMPKTSFEMRGKLPSKEPGFQKRWKEMSIYEKMQEKERDVKHLFCMMDLLMQMVIFI